MKILEIIQNNMKEFTKALLISALVVFIFILGVASTFLILNQQNNENLNDFFYLNYQNFIQKEGASNIEQIVQEVDPISSPHEKLNSIANLIVTNFTNPFWAESGDNLFINECPGAISFNHRYFGKNCNGFGFDKKGAVRIRTGNLTNNPYWIAYYKTGACGELATLFANVSNQSGFVTRVVYSSDPDHAWTEVCLDGEWLYFDTDMYHNRKGDPERQKDWFDNTSSFENKLGWRFSKVSVANSTRNGYEEDRTKFYTKTGTVKISIFKPIDKIVIREINHVSYVWTFEPSCSSYPCVIESDLGSGKNYLLQRYVSSVGLLFDLDKFSIKENEIVNIGVDILVRLNGSFNAFSKMTLIRASTFTNFKPVPIK